MDKRMEPEDKVGGQEGQGDLACWEGKGWVSI